jgi:hypothetical protein
MHCFGDGWYVVHKWGMEKGIRKLDENLTKLRNSSKVEIKCSTL